MIAAVTVGIVAFVWLPSSREFETGIQVSIANTIVQDQEKLAQEGYLSPEGSVVVRIKPGVSSFEPETWIDAPYTSIWKYEKGILKPASPADFEQVKKDRNAYIFVFLIQKIEGNQASVDVATYYPTSNTPGFSNSGGEASHCVFEYIDQNWYELNVDTYANWD